MLTFLREHWRPFACVLGALACFAVGRFSATPPEVHDSSETSDAISVNQTVWSGWSYHRVTDTNVVIVHDKTTLPDGSVHEHSEERAATHVDERAAENSGGHTEAKEDRTALTRHDLIPELPRRRLALLAGGAVSFEPLGASPLFGVGFDYRFAGPFSVGAVVLIRPAPLNVGVLGSVSVAF